MKAIELELMKEYRYLSNLYSLNDDLYYTDTVADMDNNDYLQSLHRLKKDGSEEKKKRPAQFEDFFKPNGEFDAELTDATLASILEGYDCADSFP